MKRLQCAICLLYVVLPPLLLQITAKAADWKLVSGLGLTEEYNDNILFQETPSALEMVTTLDGRLSAVKSTERGALKMSGSLSATEYSKSSSLNSWDQSYSLSVNRSLSERLQLGMSLGVVRDSRPDRYLNEGGLVTDTAVRWLEQTQLNASYAWSENTSSNISYAFSNQYFDGRDTGKSRSHGITMTTMFHPFWKPANSSIFTELRWGINDFFTSKVEEYTGVAGYGFSLSELWRLTLGGGLQYSRTTTKGQRIEFRTNTLTSPPSLEVVGRVPVDITGADRGWTSRMILDYHGEQVKATAQLYHDYYPASDYGSLAIRDRVVLKASQRLNVNMTVSLVSDYTRTQSIGNGHGSRGLDTRIWRLQPQLSYTLSKEVSLKVKYAYTNNLDRLTGIAEVQNRASVSLNFDRNLLE